MGQSKRPKPEDFFKSLHNPEWEYHITSTDSSRFSRYGVSSFYIYDTLVLLAQRTYGDEYPIGKFSVLSASAGKLIWEKTFHQHDIFWNYDNSNLLLEEDTSIECFDLYTGKLKWTFFPQDSGSREWSIHYDDTLMYLVRTLRIVPTPPSDLYVINEKTGKIIKSYKSFLNANNLEMVYVHNSKAIFRIRGDNLTLFDFNKNERKWSVSVSLGDVEESMRKHIQGDTIIFRSSVSMPPEGGAYFSAVDIQTGKLTSNILDNAKPFDPYLSIYYVANGEIYLGLNDPLQKKGKLDSTHTYLHVVKYNTKAFKKSWEIIIDTTLGFGGRSESIGYDTNNLYFLLENTIVAIDRITGRKVFSPFTFPFDIGKFNEWGNFLILDTYNTTTGKHSTVIVNKSNPSDIATENTDLDLLDTDSSHNFLYLIDNKSRLLKISLPQSKR